MYFLTFGKKTKQKGMSKKKEGIWKENDTPEIKTVRKQNS